MATSKMGFSLSHLVMRARVMPCTRTLSRPSGSLSWRMTMPTVPSSLSSAGLGWSTLGSRWVERKTN